MKVMSTRLSFNSVFERETRENLAGQQQQVRNKHGRRRRGRKGAGSTKAVWELSEEVKRTGFRWKTRSASGIACGSWLLQHLEVKQVSERTRFAIFCDRVGVRRDSGVSAP